MIYRPFEGPLMGVRPEKQKTDGERCTSNEFAKEVVAMFATGPYWSERFENEYEAMTPRERKLVDAAVEKQMERVRKFLGQG